MPDENYTPDLQELVFEVIEKGGKVLIVGDMPHKDHCPRSKIIEFVDSKKILSINTIPKADLIIRLKTMPHKADFKIANAKRQNVIVFPELVTSNEIRRTLKAIEAKLSA